MSVRPYVHPSALEVCVCGGGGWGRGEKEIFPPHEKKIVRAYRGGGGVRGFAYGCVQAGGGGQKIREMMRTYFMDGP